MRVCFECVCLAGRSFVQSREGNISTCLLGQKKYGARTETTTACYVCSIAAKHMHILITETRRTNKQSLQLFTDFIIHHKLLLQLFQCVIYITIFYKKGKKSQDFTQISADIINSSLKGVNKIFFEFVFLLFQPILLTDE